MVINSDSQKCIAMLLQTSLLQCILQCVTSFAIIHIAIYCNTIRNLRPQNHGWLLRIGVTDLYRILETSNLLIERVKSSVDFSEMIALYVQIYSKVTKFDCGTTLFFYKFNKNKLKVF